MNQNEVFRYSDRHKIGASFDTIPHPGNGGIVSQNTVTANCPSCGSPRVNLIVMPDHCPHHAARRCGGCDRFLSWEQKPVNQQKRQRQQEMIGQLLKSTRLSQWERDFLVGLKNRKISLKQQEVLKKIEAKVGVRG